MNGYSVFFDLPDDCLCKAAPTSTSAGLMAASFSSGQPRGGVFARERLPAVSEGLRIKIYIYRERASKVLQQRMLRVLVAQDGMLRGDAPVDTERTVQNADAAVGFGVIEVVALVLEDRRLAQYREAVREASWDEELAMVVLAQFDGHVLPVGGAAAPDVHRNVQHPSAHAAHQFALSEWRRLEMKAAHHPVDGLGLVVLHEVDLPYLLLELPLGEALEEVSARVLEHLRFNDKHAIYVCLYHFHISAKYARQLLARISQQSIFGHRCEPSS